MLLLLLHLLSCHTVTSRNISDLNLVDGTYRTADGEPFSGEVHTLFPGSKDRSAKAHLVNGQVQGRTVSYGYGGELISESYVDQLAYLDASPKEVLAVSGWITREGSFFEYGLTVIVNKLLKDELPDTLLNDYFQAAITSLPPPTNNAPIKTLRINYRTGDFETPHKTEVLEIN